MSGPAHRARDWSPPWGTGTPRDPSNECGPGGLRFRPGPTSSGGGTRALARALCGLASPPHLPQRNCPIDFGGSLRMAFSAPARRFPLVTVKTSGCRAVTDLGPARLAGTAFWRTARVALGPQQIAGAPGG